MEKRLLTDSHRAVGRWHVLGHEDEVLPGELTYDPETGLRLEVVGLFGGFPRSLRVGDPTERHPIILGSTSDQQITLYDCAQVNKQIKIPGEGSTTYRAVFAVFGGHADGEGLPSVDEVAVRVPLLDAWLPVSGLGMQIRQSADHRLQEYVNSYEPPDSVEIALPWGQLKIVPAAKFHSPTSTIDRTASIEEWLEVNLELTAEAPIDEVLNDRISPLVDLATLLTSYPAQISYLGLRAEVTGFDGEPMDIRDTLDILFQPSFAGTPSPDKVDERRFLVSPESTERPPLEDLITRWYSCRDRLKRSMDMMFGMERSPRGTYTEVRFLTLCHAAEAMHRDQPLRQERWTKAEYKGLKAAVVEAVTDPTTLRLLKEQLSYAKFLNLRDRLLALRDWSLGSGSELISDTVIGRIVTARNNLTHSSTKELARLEDSADLYYLTQYVIWLLRACFLIELGFTRGEVAAVIKASDQFDWLRRAFPLDPEESDDASEASPTVDGDGEEATLGTAAAD